MYLRVYIFSGLGVDERAFKNINFYDLDVTHVDCIEQLKNESLTEHAKRISSVITVENPILIGLSFGEMVAVEIAKIMNVEKLILISSAKTKNELSMSSRISGKLKLMKLIPEKAFKESNIITNSLFGAKTEEEKRFLYEILADTNQDFLQWALLEMARWNNTIKPKHFFHIHGTKDRIIPIRNVEATQLIKNGGHLMVLNRAKEIEEIILKILSTKQCKKAQQVDTTSNL